MARSSIPSYLASGMCRPDGPLCPTRRAGHFLPAAMNCSANGTRTMSPRTPSLQIKIAPVKWVNLYAPWYDSYSALMPNPQASRTSDSAEPGSRETGTDYVEIIKEYKHISPAALDPGSALRLSGEQKQCRCCYKIQGSVILWTGIMLFLQSFYSGFCV